MAKLSFPPVYTDDPQDIKRVKQAALDQDESASSFQYRVIMAAVEAHEAAKADGNAAAQLPKEEG